MNTVKLINIGNLVTYSSVDNSVVSLEGIEIVISDGKIIDTVSYTHLTLPTILRV